MNNHSTIVNPAMKTVRFDSLTIKEYNVELGDNPACTAGAPIQIGWEPIRTTTRNLDLFELVRERSSPRRKPKDLSLPPHKRAERLFRAGYSLDEVVHATLKCEAAKKLRAETLQKQGWDRFSEFIRRTGKIPKGILVGASGTLLRRVQTSTGLFTGASGTLKGRGRSLHRGLMENTGRSLRNIRPNSKITLLARTA